MSNQKDVSKNLVYTPDTKSKRQEISWTGLAVQFNENSPPIHNWFGWVRIWSDYQANLKRKIAAEQKLSKRKNCKKRIPFNTLELKVIDFLKLERVKAKKISETSFRMISPKTDVQNHLTNMEHSMDMNHCTNDTVIMSDDQENMQDENNGRISVEDMSFKIHQQILDELKESNQLHRNTNKLQERMLQIEKEKLNERLKTVKRYELTIPKHRTRERLVEYVIIIFVTVLIIYII